MVSYGVLVKVTTQVRKSSKMGPHLGRIFPIVKFLTSKSAKRYSVYAATEAEKPVVIIPLRCAPPCLASSQEVHF